MPAGVALVLGLGFLATGSPVDAADVTPIRLGSAATFAVLACGAAITNSGSTVIDGDIGIFPAAVVDGLPPGRLNGAIHVANAVAHQAKLDALAAHEEAASREPSAILDGGELGGLTLVAGVYTAARLSLHLTGTVTLDGQDDPNAAWIFQTTSDLVTTGSSAVALINGAQACNVVWQVAQSARLGADSQFAGTLIAKGSIALQSSVILTGRVLAGTGSVTLMNDHISYPTCRVRENSGPSPAPSAASPTTLSPTSKPASAVVEITSAPAAGSEPQPVSVSGATGGSQAAISPMVALGIVVSLGSLVILRRRGWLPRHPAAGLAGGP